MVETVPFGVNLLYYYFLSVSIEYFGILLNTNTHRIKRYRGTTKDYSVNYANPRRTNELQQRGLDRDHEIYRATPLMVKTQIVSYCYLKHSYNWFNSGISIFKTHISEYKIYQT